MASPAGDVQSAKLSQHDEMKERLLHGCFCHSVGSHCDMLCRFLFTCYLWHVLSFSGLLRALTFLKTCCLALLFLPGMLTLSLCLLLAPSLFYRLSLSIIRLLPLFVSHLLTCTLLSRPPCHSLTLCLSHSLCESCWPAWLLFLSLACLLAHSLGLLLALSVYIYCSLCLLITCSLAPLLCLPLAHSLAPPLT